MAEPFITKCGYDLGDTRPPSFPVNRIVKILDQILAIQGGAFPVGAKEARNALAASGSSWMPASEVAAYLYDMVKVVFDGRGRVTVRYVGDLKPTEYPTDVEFFSIASGIEQGEFSRLLREAVIRGGGKQTLINLSNVRDIVIDAGSSDIRNLGAEVSWLSAVADTFLAWGDATLAIKEGP
jgi:hypothetical protein